MPSLPQKGGKGRGVGAVVQRTGSDDALSLKRRRRDSAIADGLYTREAITIDAPDEKRGGDNSAKAAK